MPHSFLCSKASAVYFVSACQFAADLIESQINEGKISATEKRTKRNSPVTALIA